MSARYVRPKRAGWGVRPQVRSRRPTGTPVARGACALRAIAAYVLAVALVTRITVHAPLAAAEPAADAAAAHGTAAGDPVTTVPDAPARAQPVVVAPSTLRPSWDLDGVYLWLGPTGAASYLDAQWDSTFGGDAALVVVREREPVSLLGASLGASRWTVRGGGRVWIDGLVGTRSLGRMMGASIGAILELSELKHPKLGASIGVWTFAGVTPFARIGAVSDLGMFAELGLHIALPVMRR
jgi:hypothetical protein